MKLLALLLSLTLLVITHELGHLGFAKLFHTRVRRFYVFFNWKFSIFKAKKFDGKWHFLFFNSQLPDSWYSNTDQPRYVTKTDEKGNEYQEDQWVEKEPDNTLWGIGWIPLGGYCDIAGMIDETKSAKDMESEPQPWEYRSKKPLQRLCIISGGVLVNFLSALVIYAGIFAHWGKDELPIRNAELGYEYNQILLDEGLQNGDIVWSIDGQNPDDIYQVQKDLTLKDTCTLVVKRTHTEIVRDSLTQTATCQYAERFDTIPISGEVNRRILAEQPRDLIGLQMPFVVKDFTAGSVARKAGMQKGDRVVSFNGEVCQTYTEITAALAEHKDQEVTIGFIRDEEYQEVAVALGGDGKLGVQLTSPEEVFDVEHHDYNFLQAIPEGISYGWETLCTYVSSLKIIFKKDGAKQLGGFGTLGSIFPEEWNWLSFWGNTSLLALILAFMNIIPIPGLDGGHILFTLWEIITRRKPSDRFLEISQTIGFYLLLALLIVANGNDILRALGLM